MKYSPGDLIQMPKVQDGVLTLIVTLDLRYDTYRSIDFHSLGTFHYHDPASDLDNYSELLTDIFQEPL